ncbi:MAG: DUF1549 domain-containing protein, partial [Verrucomicrobiota bacterium]
DDFITWQLAGDLLPESTMEQKVATGFLRNNTTSNEGGIIDEDYRIKYLVDRVNTTATAFLGLTLECAQCHDHKFDPMTQKEYFEFGGFFNNLVGKGNTKGSTAPTLKVRSSEDEQRIGALHQQIAALDRQLSADSEELRSAYAGWRGQVARIAWQPARLISAHADGKGALTLSGQQIVRKPPPEPDEEEPGRISDLSGRFIRVQLPEDTPQFLTISEVDVYSGGLNIAARGKARQSSDYGGNNRADKALDSDRGGSFGGCACTREEKAAWWEVDLGATHPIDSILLWNRHDCCPERLDRATVLLLDEERNEVSRTFFEKAGQENAWVLNPDARPPREDGEKATDTLVLGGLD